MKRNIAIVILTLAVLAALGACFSVREQPQIAAAGYGDVAIDAVTMTLTGTGATTASTTSSHLSGELLGIYIDYTASITNTCDITVTYTSPLGGQILAQVNNVTDTFYPVRASPVTNAAAAITDGNVTFPLAGKLTVTFGQTTPGTVGTMYVLYRR